MGFIQLYAAPLAAKAVCCIIDVRADVPPLLGGGLVKIKHLTGWVQGELHCLWELWFTVDILGEHWIMSDPDHHPDLSLHNLTLGGKCCSHLPCYSAQLLAHHPSWTSCSSLCWQLTWLSLEIWVCYRFVSIRTSPWLWVLNILISQSRAVKKLIFICGRKSIM